MEHHEIANVFPMMGDAEIDDLGADIKRHGLAHPVVVYEEKILDGRNRFEACKRVGVPCGLMDFDGDDPIAFVVSSNLHRRHLTKPQRIVAAGRIEGLRHGVNRGTTDGEISPSKSDVAKKLNVSEYDIKKARKVLATGTPEVIEATAAGAISIDAAEALATVSHEAQRTVLKEAKKAHRKVTAEAARRIALSELAEPIPETWRDDLILTIRNATSSVSGQAKLLQAILDMNEDEQAGIGELIASGDGWNQSLAMTKAAGLDPPADPTWNLLYDIEVAAKNARKMLPDTWSERLEFIQREAHAIQEETTKWRKQMGS